MAEAPEFLMVAGAPAPVAPFSHAVRAGKFLFVTGQMPTDPEDQSRPLPEGVAAQTRRVIENLRIVLEGAGYAWRDVVQARIYLTDFHRDYAAMNEIWSSLFPAGRRPARTCVGVNGLAVGALIEIDLVAWKPKADQGPDFSPPAPRSPRPPARRAGGARDG